MTTPTELTALLRGNRYRMGSEALLQQDIETLLGLRQIKFERETRLGPGERIDFLVEGGIGVEVKVRYPKRSIFRQLVRYAEHERISSLILVSGTAMGLPTAVLGKPLFSVPLGRSAL